MSAALDRAYLPYRKRLIDDAHAYFEACLELAKAEAAGTGGDLPTSGSSEMQAAYVRWRGDVKKALSRVQGLPRSDPGKATAVAAMTTLDAALDLIGKGIAPVVPVKRALELSDQALRKLEAYHRLADALDRRLG